MIVLKYICFVIAVVATLLYVNNLIADFNRVNNFRGMFSGDEKEGENYEQVAETFANLRFILSIIMGVTWGVVFIL